MRMTTFDHGKVTATRVKGPGPPGIDVRPSAARRAEVWWIVLIREACLRCQRTHPPLRGAGSHRSTRESCYTDLVVNLTITVDEATLKSARIKALERGESVNQFLAEQLRRYAETPDARVARQRDGVARMVERARRAGSGSGGWKWDRQDLYEARSR